METQNCQIFHNNAGMIQQRIDQSNILLMYYYSCKNIYMGCRDIAISMKLLSTWNEIVIGAIKEAFRSCPHFIYERTCTTPIREREQRHAPQSSTRYARDGRNGGKNLKVGRNFVYQLFSAVADKIIPH